MLLTMMEPNERKAEKNRIKASLKEILPIEIT